MPARLRIVKMIPCGSSNDSQLAGAVLAQASGTRSPEQRLPYQGRRRGIHPPAPGVPGAGGCDDSHAWFSPTLCFARGCICVRVRRSRTPVPAIPRRGHGAPVHLLHCSPGLAVALAHMSDACVFAASTRLCLGVTCLKIRTWRITWGTRHSFRVRTLRTRICSGIWARYLTYPVALTHPFACRFACSHTCARGRTDTPGAS